MLVILTAFVIYLKPVRYTGQHISGGPTLIIENPINGFVYNSDESTVFSAVLKGDISMIVGFKITKNGISQNIDPLKLKITNIGNPVYARRIELPLGYLGFDEVWSGRYNIGTNTIEVEIKTNANLLGYTSAVNYVLSW